MAETATNTVLLDVQTFLLGLEGYTEDRVHIGDYEPANLGADPEIVICSMRDVLLTVSGTVSQRQLQLEVGLYLKMDVNDAKASELKFNAAYRPVHARMEKLAGGKPSFIKCTEDPMGVLYLTVQRKQRQREAHCLWNITYKQTLGSV